MNLIKEVGIRETEDIRIARVRLANFTHDTIFILDSPSGNLKLYSHSGNPYAVLFQRGVSPKELSQPIAIAITDNSLVIPDAAVSAIKIFNKKGENTNYVFLEDVKAFTSDGNIFYLSDSLFLSSFSFKYGFAQTPVITVSDKTGKTLARLGKYPDDYYAFSKDSYPMLESRYFDIRNNYLIAITFVSSPAIQFVSMDNKIQKMFPFQEKRERYISKERLSKPNASFEEMLKISFIEMYNYAIFFVNDSTVIRAFNQKTEESYQKRSFVLRKNFLEAYSTSGDFLGELPLPGYLHAVRGDTLLIEESDEPDNRRFGLYHLVWTKNNVANQ
ncbi:MAG: hypothetical protein HY22_14395 [[Candidatus Thermochlorobacteriaceae] bacterium GBChlB]|nr:MAG: hypothetical protein HY22_14395 [[Candidatus Thermochlorobacteriaceae] bacterium GBChlB]